MECCDATSLDDQPTQRIVIWLVSVAILRRQGESPSLVMMLGGRRRARAARQIA